MGTIQSLFNGDQGFQGRVIIGYSQTGQNWRETRLKVAGNGYASWEFYSQLARNGFGELRGMHGLL